MTIAGREYHLMLTVKARRALRALCPEKDLEKLDDYLTGADSEEHASELLIILSNGYEDYKAFWSAQEGKQYDPQPLTAELLENLSMEDHLELQKEALIALRKGFGITVETEEPKEEGKKSADADPSEKQS